MVKPSGKLIIVELEVIDGLASSSHVPLSLGCHDNIIHTLHKRIRAFVSYLINTNACLIVTRRVVELVVVS
jgi:hypothetical protein